MSNDFVALFDITVPGVTLEWLLARIEERSPLFAGLVDRYCRKDEARRWEILDGEQIFGPCAGPGFFAFRIHGRMLEMNHMIRFSAFSGDEWHRGQLLSICEAMAELVGSRRAIYTHELANYGGENLDANEATLRTTTGPPAATFEELDEADYWRPHSWYVDTFGKVPA